LGTSGGKWSESDHEEMESWERNKVDSEFSKIRVKLTRESDRTSNTRHSNGDEMVQVTIGWSGKFKSSEAYII